MITLKTLSQATEQEVFDQAVTHLLTQNKKCISLDNILNKELCVYKSGNLKCAAGIFIADDEYEEQMEKKEWNELVGNKLVPEEHSILIRDIQLIHDINDPTDWKEELLDLAKKYSLSPKIVTEWSS